MSDLESQLRAARQAFLERVGDIRPELHRYCARMTGSVVDGEDMVQEVLAQAFFRLSQFHDGMALRPRLFRIAHNRCIDHRRARRPETFLEDPDMYAAGTTDDPAQTQQETAAALTVLLERLAPRERSCLLLMDVMGYSVHEIAGLTDTTDGAVKTAIHRARAKLTGLPPLSTITPSRNPGPLLERYIERFNAQDWDGATALLADDARLVVVGINESRGRRAVRDTYMRNYQSIADRWWFELVNVDGAPAALCWRCHDGVWAARSLCLIEGSDDGTIVRIRDYVPVPYLLNEAQVPSPPNTRGLVPPS